MLDKKEQIINAAPNSTNIQAGRDVYIAGGPKELIDEAITRDLLEIRRKRFFGEYDKIPNVLRLGNLLASGDYVGGSSEVKAKALAWCARLLAGAEEYLDQANNFLIQAENAHAHDEVTIARAFLLSQDGSKRGALKLLAGLNSSEARSAAFRIVGFHDGPQESQQWLTNINCRIQELDPDGKLLYLSQLLELGLWSEALAAQEFLNEGDFDLAPALIHVVGIIQLVQAVPEEFRERIILQVPFELREFPLGGDTDSIFHRNEAKKYFATSYDVALNLDCPLAASIDKEFELWLEIRHSETEVKGRENLIAHLSDGKSVIRFINFALQFNLKIDLDEIRREIHKQIALNGGSTLETAFALFCLAFKEKTPAHVVNYIELHFDEMEGFISPNHLRFILVKMLAKSGDLDKARSRLDEFKQSTLLSEIEVEKLDGIISSSNEEIDSLELKRKEFDSSDSLPDLMSLVSELEGRQEWRELANYSKKLFERTKSIKDAELYVVALMNSRQSGLAVEFASNNREYLENSNIVLLNYCWGLFYEGKIAEAELHLDRVEQDCRDSNYRALNINILISLGKWELLSAVVAEEFKNRSERSAQELLQMAKLAFHIKAPLGKDLLFEAAGKSDGDSEVLAAAYFLAVNAGLEDDLDVGQWLQTAAANSGEEGPIQIKTLEDLIELKPEWDERENSVWKNLSRAEMPIFMAAESLRSTTLELTLCSAIRNENENNVYRRGVIPAFSGSRNLVNIDLSSANVGVDATALITLGYLGKLDRAFDSFDTVYIPHTMLFWLFDELSRAEFHQPSRIKSAHKIQDYVAREVIHKLSQSVVARPELSQIVGDELAQLLAEARRLSDDLGQQCIVVRPAPVYVVSTLMKEEASLEGEENYLSSCLSVIERMSDRGLLTRGDEEKARSYLKLQEKPWPNQPEFQEGAILILDDLALTYFMRLGVVEKIDKAGFSKVIVSTHVIKEAGGLIAQETTFNNILEILNEVRSFLSKGIETGKFKFSRLRSVSSEESSGSIKEDPLMGAIDSAGKCDFIITDDRFLNKFNDVGEEGERAHTLTSLDLLFSLHKSNVISSEEYFSSKTKMRRSGYCFVPFEEAEMLELISACRVVNGALVPGFDLKSIADSLLRLQMLDWLQLPQEAPWLQSHLIVFVRVLKKLWTKDESVENIIARSNWLLTLIDVRGWAHRLLIQDAREVQYIQGPYIASLITPPEAISDEVRTDFWNWIEQAVVSPLRDDYPKLYSWLIDQSHRHIEAAVDSFVGRDNDDIAVSSLVFNLLNMTFPPSIGESLLNSQDFLEKFKLKVDVKVTFNEVGVSFSQKKLFSAIRQVLGNENTSTVKDVNEQDWQLSFGNEDNVDQLVLSNGEVDLILPDSGYLSPDASVRLASHTKRCKDVNLSFSATENWNTILTDRSLTDSESGDYDADFLLTPIAFLRSLSKEIKSNKEHGKVSDIVPSSQVYYDRLVCAYDNSENVNDFIHGAIKSFVSDLISSDPIEGFLHGLLLASHPLVSEVFDVDDLSDQDLVEIYNRIEGCGDSLSMVGALEIGMRILPDKPFLYESLVRLVSLMKNENVDDAKSSVKNLVGLFVLVDGELSRLRLMEDVPPFYRRMTSLAQASLVYRKFREYGVDNMLYDWAMNNRGMHFYWQNLIDLRQEPRWLPDMMDPVQMQQECFGRMINLFSKYQDRDEEDLCKKLVDSEYKSILEKCKVLLPYYPGPIEGGGEHPNAPPPDLSEAIRSQLNPDDENSYSFIAVVNSAKIFKLDDSHIEQVSKALRLIRYKLNDIKDNNELVSVLTGLAHIAAINRNVSLANEVRILTRVYRRNSNYEVTVIDCLRVCFIASAANCNLLEWGGFISDWVFELAYEELSSEDAETAYSYLTFVLDLYPSLWRSCAKAEAVLKSKRVA